MNKPFNLQDALAGKPVWHDPRKLLVKNLTQVGQRLVFQLPGDGETIYNTELDGTSVSDTEYARTILQMAPTAVTKWVNLWDSPSFHYTIHPTEADARAAKGTSYTGRNYAKLNPDPIQFTYEV